MNYYLKYYSNFKDRDNNSIRIEIYTSTNTGASEEVLMPADTVTIEYTADSIFDSLKPSKASVNLLVRDLATSLFTGTLNGTMIKVKRNDELFWFGYVQPNVYTQPYKNYYDSLTLQCIDTIAQLKNVKYTYTPNASEGSIQSFFNIITHCLSYVDPNHNISTIYVDNSIKANNLFDVLDNVYIQERNFFDEKNEAEQCDVVVGEILKYLGLTMIQYKYSYYIIEQGSNLFAQSYTLNKYTYSNNGWSKVGTEALALKTMSSAEIGIGESAGEVGLDGVFNKVTVIANNNPLGQILPDFDDSNDIVNQNSNPNNYYEETYTKDENTYKLLTGFFKSNSNWTYTQPSALGGQVSEVTLSNRDSITSGVYWQKVDSYNIADGVPSSLSWKLYMTMTGGGLMGSIPYVQLNKTKTMILDGGYLILNLKYKFSTDSRPHSEVQSLNVYGHPIQDLMWNSSVDNIGRGGWHRYGTTKFQCQIKIGGYCYTGRNTESGWERISECQNRVSRYNSTYNAWGLDFSGNQRHWYRIKNNYGDWEYVTESAYNSFSGTKEDGDCVVGDTYYVGRFDSGNEHVYIDDYFYDEMMIPYSFWACHQNKTNEKIYDTEYALTNTVSYTMNITDSSDGVAIKCPDFSLYGQIEFTMYAPSTLGTDPNPRNDLADTYLKAIHISDLTLKYSKTRAGKSIYDNSSIDPDTKYTNVINSGFCKELDDVELKVNTKNDYATSYSYVIGKSGNNYFYITDFNFGNGNKKPEEHLVNKLVNYYSTPKYQYGNILKNRDAIAYKIYGETTPFFPFAETLDGVSRNMIVRDITYNISNNTAKIIGQEI